uniref:Sushi domain-containing protein n=1 Tax=Varanus komodoensis TaxID=61221 RepID=A0A8D2KYG7_VARKO
MESLLEKTSDTSNLQYTFVMLAILLLESTTLLIGNGTHDQKGLEDFPYGSSVTYLCDPGYILIGSATIHCLSSGVWDGPVPKFAGCPPPFIQNGGHSSQQAAVFTRGMVVTYTCDSGYNLTGEKTIYCTDLGTWSFPAPRCEGMLFRIVHCGSRNAIYTMGKSSLEELKTCLRQLPKLRSLQIFQNY